MWARVDEEGGYVVVQDTSPLARWIADWSGSDRKINPSPFSVEANNLLTEFELSLPIELADISSFNADIIA